MIKEREGGLWENGGELVRQTGQQGRTGRESTGPGEQRVKF